MVRFRTSLGMLMAALLAGGCTVAPPANTPLPKAPAQWDGQVAPLDTMAPTDAASQTRLDSAWWTVLNDPALNAIMDATMESSPTLASALARLEETQASANVQSAAQQPQLKGTVQASRATAASDANVVQNSASITQSMGWEIDLFGRLRHNRAAAEQRLLSATAEATWTRLSLQAQVVDSVIQTRGCLAQTATWREEVLSRQVTHRVTELRQGAGLQAVTDVARARSALSDTQSNLAQSEAQCTDTMLQLAAFSGWPAGRVRSLLEASLPKGSQAVPTPPHFQAALPATVLANHPSIQAALRTADAAWEDLGSAEASKRPSLSIDLLLGSNWLQVAGNTVRSTSWSLAPSSNLTLWDAGRSQAQTDAARARHKQALAALDSAVRNAVKETEQALAQADSTAEREHQASQGLQAAQDVLRASMASHAAGRLGLLELEDARRSAQNAQLTHIGARRDRARAWVSLVRATANAGLQGSATHTLHQLRSSL